MRRTTLPLAVSLAALSVVAHVALPARASAQEPYRLSDLVRELEPAVRAKVLRRLGRSPRAAALITTAQRRALRDAIARQDWSAVDRFPAVTVKGLGDAIEATAPGANASTPRPAGDDSTAPRDALDLEALDIPEDEGRVAARLADVLNRLAENDPQSPAFAILLGPSRCVSPDQLLGQLLRSGHTVVVQDVRTLANFGDLRFRGKDVTAPLWVDTGVTVPGTTRSLLVPATHSEHRLSVRGMQVSAELCFYFGIDGEAKFRELTPDADWVAGKIAHTYTGEHALKAMRLAGDVRRVFRAKVKAHGLSTGGYYALGVCNDVTALIELAMTNSATLFPLTRDLRFFQGPGEIDALARRLPIDSEGEPDLERIVGGLPVEALGDLRFPQLRADLEAFSRSEAHRGLADLELFQD